MFWLLALHFKSKPNFIWHILLTSCCLLLYHIKRLPHKLVSERLEYNSPPFKINSPHRWIIPKIINYPCANKTGTSQNHATVDWTQFWSFLRKQCDRSKHQWKFSHFYIKVHILKICDINFPVIYLWNQII